MSPINPLSRPSGFVPSPAAQVKKSTADKIRENGPRFILLNGITSTGKSSIMNQCALDKNIEACGTDDFAQKRFAPLIKKLCSETEAEILTKAIKDEHIEQFFADPEGAKANPVIYKKGSSADAIAAAHALNADLKFFERISAALSMHNDLPGQKGALQDRAHFEEVIKVSRSGKTVILDTPNAKGFLAYLETLPSHPPVHSFLVYIPVAELVKRLPGRNAEAIRTGNLFDRRQYIDVFRQFMNFYRPAREGDARIDILKREDVERMFKENASAIAEENARARTNGREDLVRTLEGVLNHFGLDVPGCTEVFIATTEFQRFEGIFRTANPGQTPAMSALQLASHSWEKLL